MNSSTKTYPGFITYFQNWIKQDKFPQKDGKIDTELKKTIGFLKPNFTITLEREFYLYVRDQGLSRLGTSEANLLKVILHLYYNELITKTQKDILTNIYCTRLPQIEENGANNISRYEQMSNAIPEPIKLQVQKVNDLDLLLQEIVDKEMQEAKLASESYQEIWDSFYYLLLKINFKSLKLYNVVLKKYGSSETLFKTKSSDIDCTLLTDTYVDERVLVDTLYQMLKQIYERTYPNVKEWKFEKLDGENVRVPLVSVEAPTKNGQKVKIELTINNIHGVINTKLLDIYSKIDPRSASLGILVKLWAKRNQLCSGKDMISSYGYNNMVINFLQMIQPPVLPNLQGKKGEKIKVERMTENRTVDIQEIDIGFEQDVQAIRLKMAKNPNKMGLGELFINFFKTLKENFLNPNLSVSIRSGHMIPRKVGNPDDFAWNGNPQDYLISIDDPFDEAHNPGRNLLKNSENAYQFKLVLDDHSSRLMSRANSLALMKETLNSIFDQKDSQLKKPTNNLNGVSRSNSQNSDSSSRNIDSTTNKSMAEMLKDMNRY